MEPERTRILEMLQSGQLTVEQASQLLDALAQAQKAEAKAPAPPAEEPEEQPEPGPADRPGFGRNISQLIRNGMSEGLSGLGGLGHPGGLGAANFSSTTLSRAALERLTDGASYTNFGRLTIADDVPEELLARKIANCTNFGSVQGPPHLVKLLEERCFLNFGGFRRHDGRGPAAPVPHSSEPTEELVLTGQSLGGWQDWPVQLQYQELSIKCHAGNVVVEGTDEDSLQLTVLRPASLGGQPDWASRIRFAPRLEGRTLVFEIGDPKQPGNTANHTFRFGLPTDLKELALKTGYDAAINVTVDTGGGSVTASSLPGWVDLRTGGGDVTCSEIAGNATVNTGGGNVEVSDIGGTASLHTGGGEVKASDVSGNLEAKTGGGDIELSDIGGEVVAKTGGGDIEVHDIAGNASATTGAGDVQAADISGNLAASTGAGDVSASDITGNVAAQTGAGDIDVHDVSGNIVAKTKVGNLRIRDIRGDVTYQASHGAVEVTDVSGAVHRA